MPLNYNGQERVGALDVWSFTDETGNPFRTDDPMLALQLGAPVGSEPSPAPGVPVPNPPPPGPPGQPIPPVGSPPGPSPAPAPGTALPPGAPPQAFLGDPGQFGLGGAVPDRRTAELSLKDMGALEVRGDQALQGMQALSVPAGAPPSPAQKPVAVDMTPREHSRNPADNPDLDFGDNSAAAQGGAHAAPQAEAGQQGPHPLFQQIVESRPQARRFAASPGGFIDDQRKYKGDPGTVARLSEANRVLYEQQIKNTQARMELDEERLANESIELKLQNLKREDEMEQKRAVIAQREEYKRQGLAKIAARNQEISEMRVDAKRLFRDDPGGLIVAALATGMGAFGAALTGGRNEAGEMLQNAIRHDIDEQRREIEEARLENDKADNALQRLLDEGLDPRFAEKQLELMQQTYMATQLKTEELQKQMEYLGINTADALIAIGKDALASESTLVDMLGVEGVQKYRAPTAGGVRLPSQSEISTWLGNVEKAGNITGDLEPEAVQVERAKREMQGEDKEKTIYWQGQPIGQAASLVEAGQVRKKMAATEYLMGAVSEMKRLNQNWSAMSPTDREEAKARLTDVWMTLKSPEFYQLGVIAGPDMELMESAATNPNQFFAIGAEKKLDIIKENTMRGANTALRSQGINNTATWGQ